jgi:hypothetical protein
METKETEEREKTLNEIVTPILKAYQESIPGLEAGEVDDLTMTLNMLIKRELGLSTKAGDEAAEAELEKRLERRSAGLTVN